MKRALRASWDLLNPAKYHRSLAQLRCALAKPDAAELAHLFGEAYRQLLATVNTPGALAMVVNMESNPGWGPAMPQVAGHPWPKDYQGKPRIIVPCVRSIISKDEKVGLTSIILDNEPAEAAAFVWRPLGRGAWQRRELTRVSRAVYRVEWPDMMNDFEYRLEATPSGECLTPARSWYA